VTNGWPHTGLLAGRICPVENIGWFRDLYPEWNDLWTDEALASGEVEGVDYRHLPETLAISEGGDVEVLLLNPKVVSPDGEWEAWYFGEDGPSSYRTFWDLLQGCYVIFAQVTLTLSHQVRPSEPGDAVVVKLPGLIAEMEEKLSVARTLAANDDMGLHQGSIEGIEIAISRVRDLQGVTDPGDLREKLRALAAVLMAEATSMEAPLKKLSENSMDILMKPIPDFAAMISQLGPMMKGIREGGKAQGLRTGAEVILWYLGER
jgi:hypothetical protein